MIFTIWVVAYPASPIDPLQELGAKLRSLKFRLIAIGIGRVVPWASLSRCAMSRQRALS